MRTKLVTNVRPGDIVRGGWRVSNVNIEPRDDEYGPYTVTLTFDPETVPDWRNDLGPQRYSTFSTDGSRLRITLER